MRYYTIFLLLALLWIAGCASKPTDDLMTGWPSEEKLYQSHISATGLESVALFELNRDKVAKAHEVLTMELTFELEDLRHLSKTAAKGQVESATELARVILKNANEHKEQLLRDKYSLQMVIDCKSLVTNTADVELASNLAKYLSTSCTNQIIYPTP